MTYDSESKFLRAEASLRKCLIDEENGFLINELDVPIDSIELKKESIKMIYLGKDSENYSFEIKLLLLSPENNIIGSYTYIEDSTGNPVDDVLVFN